MHYRNGREAKNGDRVVMLGYEGKLMGAGILHGAVPGNDYCNGMLASTVNPNQAACLCDCLHAEDVEALIAAAGLDKRPAGK